MAGNTAITDTNTANKNNETWLQRNGDYLFQAGTAAAQTALSIYNNRQQNKFNASEAEKNRKFEQEMSNTAYQRAYEDMAKAGLNPHLAGGAGGASTPAGGSASGSMAETPDLMSLNNYSNQTALTKAQVDNLNAQTEAQTLSNPYIPKKTKAEIAKTEAETKLTEAQTNNVRKEFNLLDNQEKLQALELIRQHETAQNDAVKAKIEKEFYSTKFGRFARKAGMTMAEIRGITGIASEKMKEAKGAVMPIAR